MSLEADYVIGEVELDAETVPWLLDRDVLFIFFLIVAKNEAACRVACISCLFMFSSCSLFCPILYIIVVYCFCCKGPGMSDRVKVTMLSTGEKVQVLQHAMKMLDINVASPRGHWVYGNR